MSKLGVEVDRSKLHDAAGINDDYPFGRGVFIEENFEYVVLVNFEDHLQIIMLPECSVQDGIRKSMFKF